MIRTFVQCDVCGAVASQAQTKRDQWRPAKTNRKAIAHVCHRHPDMEILALDECELLNRDQMDRAWREGWAGELPHVQRVQDEMQEAISKWVEASFSDLVDLMKEHRGERLLGRGEKS